MRVIRLGDKKAEDRMNVTDWTKVLPIFREGHRPSKKGPPTRHYLPCPRINADNNVLTPTYMPWSYGASFDEIYISSK